MVLKLKNIFLSSRSICLLLMMAFLAGMLFGFKPLLSLEYKAYDLMAKLRLRAAGTPVVIVAIDDKSLESIGDWPWPRSYIADIIHTLSKNRARAQGISILYRSRELNDGLAEIQDFRENIRQNPPIGRKQTLNKIDRLLAQTQARLNHDARLISAVKRARNVVLPLRFGFGEAKSQITPELSDWLKLNSIEIVKPATARQQSAGVAVFLSERHFSRPMVASQVQQPYPDLSGKSGALGHTNLVVDPDMITRSIPLFVRFQGREFISLALQVAMKYFGAGIDNIRATSSGLQIRHIHIPTIGHHQMLVDFNGREANIEKFSAVDVLERKIPEKSFRNKIVLLGITAEEFTPLYKTPGERWASGIEIVANAVENIINRKPIARPAWSAALEILVLLYFGFFLLFVIPKIQPRIGMLIFAIFLATWIGVALGLFITQGHWLRVVTPSLFAAIGLVLAERKRMSDKKKDESIELNKSLGLSLQGQGMLDMAFERFMKCPIEDISVQALLYHLGLDFERKRMFNKALAVYNHILKAAAFKDIKSRINSLKKIEHTLVLSAGQKKKDSALFLADSTTKPTLGRYEIIKELGHGAMGTVYLGRDPSINREVAVKTLSYADVEPQQLDEVKDQFFREAEAAGKLSHPNIVTIYDVGEDDDMAYIAMELLKGKDLTEFCRKDSLLPPRRVLAVGASVAEALEYAHRQGVVHRDIKPANIILLENDQIKVADFGIARVMSSSTRTQTGVIFGTPNYMSPEQVAGKKVDGRSDLFSLGVVLFEMFSAEKPFKGENISALMYAITHNTCTPLSEIAPGTPDCCVRIVNRLLRKGVTQRYKSATQLLKQITACRQELENT